MAETLFHCDDLLWARFVALCRTRDETPGAVLRDLVRLEVKRSESRKARSDEVIDERLLVRLRLLVAEALAEAESWGGLQSALRIRGLRFVPSGGGLVLTDLEAGKPWQNQARSDPLTFPLSVGSAQGFRATPVPALRRRPLPKGDYAACASIGLSRIGRCTRAENAPTPTPIHQTSV